jgi:hypothetical protein
MTAALARVEPADLPTLSVTQVKNRLDNITELMKSAMVPAVDFGAIPGTAGKPTLLKPGAEKLCVMFQLAPAYRTEKTFHADGHLTVECVCVVHHAPTGGVLGEASAMCTTREAKYAYRKAERVCPECGKAAIIKGKAEYGGGWLCWKKKDGCDAKFDDDDSAITGQSVGRVPNPDLADAYNTVLRIAEKRALVAAVRLVTGASAIFDEEQAEHEPAAESSPAPAASKPPAKAPTPAVDRAKVAESVAKIIAAAADLDALKAAWAMLPKGFTATRDEHAAALQEAKEDRKLTILNGRIADLTEQLDYDTVKLALVGQSANVPDIDSLDADGAARLVAALESELAASVPV